MNDKKVYLHLDYDCSSLEPHLCVGAGTASAEEL
jgi:hypothetical protein